MTDRPDNKESLPVYSGGVDAGDLDFSSGEAFWDRLGDISDDTGPAAHLDDAMAGRPSPRTWLFLHPAGRGGISAAAALTFARTLAGRGQAALVLDADEQHGALTAWIGRTEHEGWIDLARYGTSVLTSGIPLPFAGKRGYVLGVGSFTPTDVTGEEIKALMARLRRQADDILITAPAHAAGLPWAEVADVRILCWDPATLGRSENARLAADFADAGCAVSGVMAFGDIPPPGVDGPEEMLVEEMLTETAPPEPEPDHAGPDQEEEPVAASAADEAPPVKEDPREPADRWTDPGVPPTFQDEEREPGRRSSNVFMIGGGVAVVVIVAAFIYWYQVLRVPSGGHFESLPTVATTRTDQPHQAAPGSGSNGGAGAGEQLGAEDAPAAAGDPVSDRAEPDGPVDDEGREAVPETGAAAEEPAAELPTPDAGTLPADEAAPSETGGTAETGDPAAAAGAFDLTPYQVPVGRDGWALHVYSLPRMEALQDEIKKLERRGFKTAVRAVDVPDKGRWYRIFLGNFASRAEAEAARPALIATLGVDYAAAKRFETAGPDQ